MALDPTAAAAVRALGGEIAGLTRRLAALEAGSRTAGLKYSSIDGGALLVNDAAGTTRQVIGAQPDGTVTAVDINGAPPGAPSAPIVAAQIGGLVAGWDGLLGGAAPLSDFLWTEVHVSPASGFTPSPATLQRTMQAGGTVTVPGLTPGTTYYAVLVAVNRSRARSAPSAQTAGVPQSTTDTIPPGSITPGLLSFSAGGQTVSIGAAAPASPAVNDLWFDTGHGGVLNQWTGTAWTAYQFGTGALAPGSVTTPLIAAGAVAAAQILAGSITGDRMAAHTLTADLLQAGIVVAQIVDGTVVTGATLQNSSSNPRTSINPDGSISITNTIGTVVFKIGPDGTIYWYTPGGTLLMQLAPGGTQAIYASLTGPTGVDFEPPSAPAILIDALSTTSATTYPNTVAVAVPAGSVITVAASCNGTTAATSVTDSGGNTYTLLQSQTAASPAQQVFQAVNVHPLGTADTITVTYAAANTNAKAIIAVATTGVPAAPLDYSAQAAGTSTAPSVAGTPSVFGDAILMIISNATPAGPTATPDGWQLAATTSAAGSQTTSVYYSTSVTSGAPVTASATLGSSLAWTAVTLAYQPAPPAAAPVPTAATLSASTAWADDGTFSCRVTKAGTAAAWGITFPPFPVQAGAGASMRVIVNGTTAPALNLPQLDWGFTFWSGPGGTGTNLGSSSHGAFNATSSFVWILTYAATAPAGAVSATAWVTEGQADTAGNSFLVDNLAVPGGLVYSNSPFATTDVLSNPIDQGINFIGLPGLTNVFGVEDPFGVQLAGIDGSGNISGQQLAAATDVTIAGQSVSGILASAASGLVNYGYISANPWPGSGTFGTAAQALFELDAQMSGGRIYEFVMPSTGIHASAAGQNITLYLRWTQDGSTPTTTSSVAAVITTVAQAAGMVEHPGIRVPFFPTADATFKFLVCGAASAAGWFFSQDPFIRCWVNDLGTNDAGQGSNNIIVLGTGGTSGGGGGAQNYTEYFYPSNTWSYNEYGQRTHNGTLYQGAYSGEGFAQHAWIQWGTGSRGNGLNTVLNYTVNKVSLRLSNTHTWYNSGATVSLHAATSPVGGTGSNLTSEVANWHIGEGNTWDNVLSSPAWAPFKAAGTTYAVLRPPGGSTDLSYYAIFTGGIGSGAAKPRLTVQYTHLRRVTMAVLAAANIKTIYQSGDAAMLGLFGLRNVTTGDTIDIAAVSQPQFQVIKRGVVMGESAFVEIAADFAGTVVTIPSGLAEDSAYLLVWGS